MATQTSTHLAMLITHLELGPHLALLDLSPFGNDFSRRQCSLFQSAINGGSPTMSPICRGKENIAMATLKLILILSHILWGPPSRAASGPRVSSPVVEYLYYQHLNFCLVG